MTINSRSFRPRLVVRVHFLLLLKMLPVLLLTHLLGLLSLDQPVVQVLVAVATDIGHILLGLLLMHVEYLLNDLPLVYQLDRHQVLVLYLADWPQELEHNGCRLLAKKGNGPLEGVYVVWKVVGMLTVQELLDVECVVLLL